MAKSAFQKRFPYGRLFLLVAILIALPIVLWSVQKAPTQTQEHAAGYTCGYSNQNGTCPSGNVCGYDSSISNFTCMSSSTYVVPTCSHGPTWSGILGHTDGATSVTYHLKLTDFCDASWTTFKLTASVPSGWSYKYKGYSANTPGYLKTSYNIDFVTYYNNDVYVTISRPSTAKSGTYAITLRAGVYATYDHMPISSTAYSTKNVSYKVIN